MAGHAVDPKRHSWNARSNAPPSIHPARAFPWNNLISVSVRLLKCGGWRTSYNTAVKLPHRSPPLVCGNVGAACQMGGTALVVELDRAGLAAQAHMDQAVAAGAGKWLYGPKASAVDCTGKSSMAAMMTLWRSFQYYLRFKGALRQQNEPLPAARAGGTGQYPPPLRCGMLYTLNHRCLLAYIINLYISLCQRQETKQPRKKLGNGVHRMQTWQTDGGHAVDGIRGAARPG